MSTADRAEVLTRLATTLATLDSERPLIWRVCEAARIMVAAEGAAITIDYTSSKRITLCTTDDISERLEDLQDVLGQGPGHDAFARGLPVSTDLGSEASKRWPAFIASAAEAFGNLVIYAAPMHSDDSVLGVLTMYRSDPLWDESESDSIQFLSNAVGAVLLRDPKSQTAADEEGEGTWASRAPINQAAGMIVAQLGVAPDDALALLRAHAFARGTDMLSIARETIARKIDFSNFNVSGD